MAGSEGARGDAVEPAVEPFPSFDQFFELEYAAVVRLGFALTGRVAVAEEVAQEAFLSAYRNWERVGRYDQPGAWVRRVAANRCVSTWRRGVTEARLVARLRRERAVTLSMSESDDAVWRAVRELPPRQRQVIALVILEDRPVVEVAAVLGLSEESVRTHLRRARSRLASRLGESEEDG